MKRSFTIILAVHQPYSIMLHVTYVPYLLEQTPRRLLNFLRRTALIRGRRLLQIIKVGLVVPAKFSTFTTEPRIAEVLERKLSSRAVKYSHFELKNVVIVKNKFPRLV